MKLKINRQNYLLYLVIFTIILLLFFYLLSDKEAIIRQLYKEFYGTSPPGALREGLVGDGLDWAVYKGTNGNVGYNNGQPILDGTPTNSGTGAVNLSSLGDITGNYVNRYTGDHNFTIILKGYFKPNVTGYWTFITASDDASFLWIGIPATKNSWNSDNATVKNGGDHGMRVAYSNKLLLQNKTKLYKDNYYPIRIQMGERGGAYELLVAWMSPNGTWSSNGSGLLFSSSLPIGEDQQASRQNGLMWKRYANYFGNYNEKVDFSNSFKLLDFGIATNTGGLSNITNGKVVENKENNIQNPHNFSLELFGYFYTNTPSTDPNAPWNFSINSDDASYLWIGDAARSGWTTGNSTINNGNLHGMQEITKYITLTPNTYYPIRLVYGENGGGFNFIFKWQPPGGNWTSDGNGYLYFEDFSEIPNDHTYDLTLGNFPTPGAQNELH